MGEARQFGRDLLQAFTLSFGFAVLCLLAEISLPLDPRHLNVYHFDGPPSVLFVPILIDIAAVWIVLAGVLTLARKGRSHAVVWSTILLAIPWIVLKDWSFLVQHRVPHLLSLGLFIVTLTGAIMAGALWKPSREEDFERMFQPGRTVLAFLSLSGLIILAELLFFFWLARGLNNPNTTVAVLPPARAAFRSATAPTRVIVIVFDELSYDQLFTSRAPRLDLPAFDAFAAQSTNFEDARPAGAYTDIAMPSLLTGQPVDAVRSSPDGRKLSLRDAHGWRNLNPENTVFYDAQRFGYTTAVAGWHIPYCRILGAVLDRCEWHSEFTSTWLTVNNHSISANALAPLHLLLHAIPGFLFSGSRRDPYRMNLERHASDYEHIVLYADEQLRDTALGFVLVHLPIPHQGAVGSRFGERTAARKSSYLDNLALADSYLAHARKLLEDRGDWQSSSVVVMGDHSWRTWLWVNSPDWTPEDTSATHGLKFDDRPALMIKLVNEQSGQRIATAFDAVRFRALLDAIMSGQVEDPASLKAWVDGKT